MSTTKTGSRRWNKSTKPSLKKTPANRSSSKKSKALPGSSKKRARGKSLARRTAAIASPIKPQAIPRVAIPAQMLTATPGDHAEILGFLTMVFQTPLQRRFAAALEDPMYEPSHRRLLKHNGRVVGHALIIPRVMHFKSTTLPTADLSWLGVSPEYRHAGLGSRLLLEMERLMFKDGAALGFLRTKTPSFFQKRGWIPVTSPGSSQTGARELLAQLQGRQPRPITPFTIRPWRQLDLGALIRLHDLNAPRISGMYQRNEETWRWLLATSGYDQILIAVSPEFNEDDFDSYGKNVLGYVVMKDDRILEIVTLPERHDVMYALAARVCGEIMERNCSSVILHAPWENPLHETFAESGGVHCPGEGLHGQISMFKILDPAMLLKLLSPLWHRAAQEARLPRPTEIGFIVDDKKISLRLHHKGISFISQKAGRNYLSLKSGDFARLLLGQIDLSAGIATGRLIPSTSLVEKILRPLFSVTPLWRSPINHQLEQWS